MSTSVAARGVVIGLVAGALQLAAIAPAHAVTKPTQVTAELTAPRTVQVTWQYVDVVPATFRVDGWGSNGAFSVSIANPAARQVSVSGLMMADTYRVYVYATDALGAKAVSDMVTVTTPPAPGASDLTLSRAAEGVWLDWQPPTDPIGGNVRGYSIWRQGVGDTAGSRGYVGFTEDLSFLDAGAVTFASYTYDVVVAYEGFTGVPVQSTIQVGPPPADPNRSPRNVTTTVTRQSTELRWQAPLDASSVASYEVYRDGRLISTTRPGALSFRDRQSSAGTTYYVAAVSTSGERFWSEAAIAAGT